MSVSSQNNAMRYADVIVDLSAEAVDRCFCYSVPEGMALSPGMLTSLSGFLPTVL